MTHTAESMTVDGKRVRILIDESDNGYTVSIWDIDAESYLHAGRKVHSNLESLIAFIVKRFSLTRIVW